MFAAHVLSILGTVFATVALAALVFDRTGSALLTALVFALTNLPYALSGVLLSGIADRHPARQVLVTCDVVSALCVAMMIIPGTPIAVLLILRTLVSMIAPLFTGTRAASLADILEGDRYILGRSLIRIVSQTAQIVGFGVGGLLLVWMSPRSALVVTVFTFAGSALLLRFGTRHRPARRSGNGALMRDSLGSAGQLLAHPRIRALLLMWWVPPMFFTLAEGVAAPLVHDASAGALGFGIFLAAMPAGTVLSEVLAGTVLSPDTRDRIAIPLAAVSLLPLAGFAFHPALPVGVALLFLSGLCAAYALGMDRWFVTEVPEEMRGRAMTLLRGRVDDPSGGRDDARRARRGLGPALRRPRRGGRPRHAHRPRGPPDRPPHRRGRRLPRVAPPKRFALPGAGVRLRTRATPGRGARVRSTASRSGPLRGLPHSARRPRPGRAVHSAGEPQLGACPGNRADQRGAVRCGASQGAGSSSYGVVCG